jgi:glyoxylase-like metal-dependent hydrolase (beta-lactamase superfamily II)
VRLGDVEVTPVLDAEGTFATIEEAFPAVTTQEVERARATFPEFFRGHDWWLPMQSVLIRAPEATVLVDTGIGPAPRTFIPDAESHLLEELGRRGVRPDDVDLVVHTHLHVDHVGWTGAFPRARYIVHRDDLAFFTTAEALESRPHLRQKLLPLQEDGLVESVPGDTEVARGVTVIPTPGHTPGHLSVRVHGGGKSLFVLGDVLVHVIQVADPDAVYVSDEDHERAAGTRRRVLSELADEGIPVIAAHLWGIGRFARAGDSFGWQPAKEEAASVE